MFQPRDSAPITCRAAAIIQSKERFASALLTWFATRRQNICGILDLLRLAINIFSCPCRKHMMCPVVVANEMSGLKGRVGVGSHPHWRLKVDAVISGPSFVAGNE